jgi:hypothetical protein
MSFLRSICAIALVLVAHALGMIGVYWLYYWYDIPVHFLGGLAAGVLGFDIWYFFVSELQVKKRWMRPWMIRFMFTMGIVSIIGIGWELHEFVLDFARSIVHGVKIVRQPSIADTMLDFVMDLSGGFVAYVITGHRKA